MIQSAEEFVKLRLSQNKEEYRRASIEPASEEVWLEVIQKYPEMRTWVAHNKTVPRKILEILSEDIDVEVRRTVASRRSASEEILYKLSSDTSELVRLTVLRNPNVSKKILQKLLSDTKKYVVDEASEALKRKGA